MRKSVLLASVAASLSLAACGNQGVEGPVGEAAASVRPDRVDPAELRAAVTDERAVAFYEARGWAPAWSRENARALNEALSEAEQHALDNEPFLEVAADANPTAQEAGLTIAAIRYAEALSDGKVDPESVRDVYTVPRPRTDVAAGLNRAVEAGQVREWLASLAPADAEYQALSQAYVDYKRRAAEERSLEIESGDTIRQGDSDSRVPQIVEALRSDGYLQPAQQGQQQRQKQQPPKQQQAESKAAQTAASTRYTAEIAAAVKRMQSEYGIADDGVIGPDTLKVLNAGAADRARTLAINLERLRWLERNPPATRVDVNTAAATLDFWKEGNHVDHRRVVVGQPGNETPPLGSPIFRLVANPTWTVPKSIEQEEIAPRGEDYLRRNNMTRRDGWIVQGSGPTNALGLVKFDMKNDHAIYLHDTPAKALFQREQRHFSHGCVRVDDALGFARLLADQFGVTSEWERARATGNETFVSLPEEIPVRLIYRTAFLDRNGQVAFRSDPYGWDEDVAQALGYDARERRRLSRHVDDVGP